MPVIYPIQIVEGGRYGFDIAPVMSENNGHRRLPAYAVPSSEVPLICSEKEWAAIRERDYRALRLSVPSWAAPASPGALLRPSRRDSSYSKGYVREISAGSWRERRLSSCVSNGCNIRVLKRFVNPETGGQLRPYVLLKDCEYDGENLLFPGFKDYHFMRCGSSRADNMRSVKDSCNRFKWKVRANERFVRLFVTLTYAENMRSTSRLYEDFRRFVQRLRRAFPDISGYLAAAEPQRRGAWHMHVLLLSLNKSLYISNKRVCSLWGRGFTKVQRVRNVRDVGEYLTAYLSNLKDGKGTKKGARLSLYPVGFRFARWSQGLASPEKCCFYGNFGDWFRDLDDYTLCYDFQNNSKKIDGVRIISRVALFYSEKPK